SHDRRHAGPLTARVRRALTVARLARSRPRMHFLSLLREHPRLMGFGVLFCFGSSIGQTFFISLFVPSIAAAYAISEASIANIYAVVTLASAAALAWAGRWIDRTDLLTYSAGVCVFLAAGCFL